MESTRTGVVGSGVGFVSCEGIFYTIQREEKRDEEKDGAVWIFLTTVLSVVEGALCGFIAHHFTCIG